MSGKHHGLSPKVVVLCKDFFRAVKKLPPEEQRMVIGFKDPDFILKYNSGGAIVRDADKVASEMLGYLNNRPEAKKTDYVPPSFTDRNQARELIRLLKKSDLPHMVALIRHTADLP